MIKVASYNVHRCVGVDCRYDSHRVIAVMKELECDIIGLQEVDNRAGRGHASLQLDHLADSMDMRPVAGLRIIKHLGEYGNALLTRHPVISVRRHDLSYSRREPRGALEVDLDVKGLTIRVVVTHLGLGPYEREHQSRQLVGVLQQWPRDQPLILLGDINEWLGGARSLGVLQASFEDLSFRRLHRFLRLHPCLRSTGYG